MKHFIVLLSVLSLSFISINLQAQDVIHKLNGEVIKCKVTRVEGEYISFQQPEINPDVTISIPKDKVRKIVYENGDILLLNDDYADSYHSSMEVGEYVPAATPQKKAHRDPLRNSKKNAIKMSFFSMISGSLNFSYEHSLAPQKSIEAGLGIIGIGGNFNPVDFFFFIPNKNTDTWNNPRGAFVRLGFKFMRDPNDYPIPSLLKGSYFKPEISYTFFSSTEKLYIDNPKPGQDIYTMVTSSHNVFAFTMNMGKQWVIEEMFLIDINIGLGYGFGIGEEGNFVFSHIQGGNLFPLAITGGFKFGFLF